MPVASERPKFLVDLLAEVDSFDAVYEPRDPVEDDETPRGTLPPWLRKMYSLGRYYTKQARILAVEHEHESLQDAEKDAEFAEMKAKAELLMQIMWASARAEMNLWSEVSIGVRQRFTIVSTKTTDDGDGLKLLLKRMFGK